YPNVLAAIKQEWEKRAHAWERPPILNENEARQFIHIYRRRADLRSADVAPQVWFLSYETLLANVFRQNARRWEMPPTFPFSAWVAFLDSRLPWVPKDPRAIVNAILKGHSSAFDLPEPVVLVRKKAFGDRVTTKDEEDATQLVLSAFHIVSKVERSRAAVLSRGRRSDAARESIEARKVAVGEISSALQETISSLREQLAKQKTELMQGRAKPKQGEEDLKEVGAEGGRKPKPVPRHKRRRRT
ncbi:MAG: hypothetical protein HW414_549, partial [Dehalococcoidia bacterium]|nr:hypothetical protein [Dehalococcoidia bacterium]